ncbi:MAG: hypothetical protein V8T87_12150, partial [Victivallales bacterium]
VTMPVLVTKEVKDIILVMLPLGPLHGPANLTGIEACEEIFPGVPNVAVSIPSSPDHAAGSLSLRHSL